MIDRNDELDTFIEYTKFKSKFIVFRKGEETVMKIPNAYGFNTWNSKYLYAKTSLLVQSGIFKIWKKYSNTFYPKYWDSALTQLRKSNWKEGGGFVPISMSSTIVTSFYIYLIGFGVALGSFIIEEIIYILKLFLFLF